MAKIVIIGAGIGGIPMAFEMKENARKEDEVVVIADTPTFHFVPSNPWVAVNWRKPSDIKVELAPVFKKKKITFIQQKVEKVKPEESQLAAESRKGQAGGEPAGAGRRQHRQLRLPDHCHRPQAGLRRDPGAGSRRPYPVGLPCRPCRPLG